MNPEARWEDRAVGELLDVAATDRRQARRIHAAVSALARSDRGDVVKLQGRTDEWRLRVGDWRVIFTRDRAAGVVTVLSVVRRREDTYRE